MGKDTRVNLAMIKKMVKVYIYPLKDKYKMDFGKMMNFQVIKLTINH